MEKRAGTAKNEFKKRVYGFTLKMIEFLDRLPKDNVSWRIGDQLLRSSTSIIGNYVEGQASSSTREYTRYFQISLKSANESKLWLALLRDSKRAAQKEVQWFLGELEEISKIFGRSIITLKSRDVKRF